MRTSQFTNESEGPSPDFLKHLEQAFGWSEGQALDALSAYIFSTEPGRALRHELDSAGPAPSKRTSKSMGSVETRMAFGQVTNPGP